MQESFNALKLDKNSLLAKASEYITLLESKSTTSQQRVKQVENQMIQLEQTRDSEHNEHIGTSQYLINLGLLRNLSELQKSIQSATTAARFD
jgi:hypothetical protein